MNAKQRNRTARCGPHTGATTRLPTFTDGYDYCRSGGEWVFKTGVLWERG